MVLLWLLPTVVATLVAMAWVAWAGREGRGEVDRDVALRRMAKVLDPAPARRWSLRRRRTPPTYAARPRRDRSSGVAVRPSSTAPAPSPSPAPAPKAGPAAAPEPDHEPDHEERRRAS